MARVGAVIVAAGEGRRFGGPKQFASLRGRQVLDWSLAAFEIHPRVDEIVLVLGETAASIFFGSMQRVAGVMSTMTGSAPR